MQVLELGSGVGKNLNTTENQLQPNPTLNLMALNGVELDMFPQLPMQCTLTFVRPTLPPHPDDPYMLSFILSTRTS